MNRLHAVLRLAASCQPIDAATDGSRQYAERTGEENAKHWTLIRAGGEDHRLWSLLLSDTRLAGLGEMVPKHGGRVRVYGTLAVAPLDSPSARAGRSRHALKSVWKT